MVGVVDRVDQLGDRARLDGAGGELEAQVDDLGAVVGRVDDALGDLRRVAVALRVEHAHRHQPHSVGQAGDAASVVGRLGDRARHLRAVAVVVFGIGAVRDEVVAPDELVGAEVRRAHEAPVIGVGDAGVEHRHDHTLPAGMARRAEVGPRLGRVDPERADEVPLQLLPTPRHTRRPRVVGVERGGFDLRGMGDVVGHRPGDRGALAQCCDRARHADATAQRHRDKRIGRRAGTRDAGPLERRVARRPGYARFESDDDDAALVRSDGRRALRDALRGRRTRRAAEGKQAERERREERPARPAGERKAHRH